MRLRKFIIFLSLLRSVSLVAQDYLEIHQMPPAMRHVLSVLMVDRRGVDEYSSMTTHGIVSVVKGGGVYQVSQDDGLVVSGEGDYSSTGADYTDIEGLWIHRGELSEDQANILGKSGKFILDVEEVVIREAIPTPENLAYYGAKLLTVGQKLYVDGYKEYPLAQMTVEENYVPGYLLQEDHGGGAYLEYHDNPHFHMPTDAAAGGYMILGRFITPTRVRVSAFKIPYGYALYTKPYTVHADSFLVGNYKVIYYVSDDYSTVLMKDREDKIVPVRVLPLGG